MAEAIAQRILILERGAGLQLTFVEGADALPGRLQRGAVGCRQPRVGRFQGAGIMDQRRHVLGRCPVEAAGVFDQRRIAAFPDIAQHLGHSFFQARGGRALPPTEALEGRSEIRRGGVEAAQLKHGAEV